MQCPYCQNPLPAGDVPECLICRLTFPRTSALVGAVPRFTPVVADTTQQLPAADHAKLKLRIQAMQRRFPELFIQLVMHRFPAEHPFPMHIFWLFNAISIAGDSRRGNQNHGILVAVDPVRCESAIMPGYGLETFLDENSTAGLLDTATPAWKDGRWREGFMNVLDGLDELLESIALPLETGEHPDNGEF